MSLRSTTPTAGGGLSSDAASSRPPGLKSAPRTVAALRVATRSLLPTTRGNLLLATLLLAIEMVLAAIAALPALPFLACAALFVGGIVAVLRWERAEPRRAARAANLIALILVLKVCGLIVGVTGGPTSLFTGILYLPIFLGALSYDVRGSLGFGAAVALFLVLFSPHAPAGAHQAALTLAGVFLFVSFFAGIFSQRLISAARSATRRARTQQQRAAEFEWFTDTSVMMESLLDLDTMLSAGLMRLMELLPCDSAGFFLRETDASQMSLVQFTSRHGATPQHTRLTLDEQEPLRLAGFGVVSWTDAERQRREMGRFAEVVPDAGSVMAATLRTWDDVFGAVYVSAREPNAFTERHRELLVMFARHVVYPIQRERLQALATTDVMTGLSNHRAFRARLKDEVDRARRYAHPLSLILLDIDHFKRVNDTLGHRAGDLLLSQIGGMLRRNSRGIDFAARYGGEEMAILCPETRPEDAAVVAERIRQAIEGRRFELADAGTVSITVSLGVAGVPESAGDEAALVEEADRALYAAKAKGRNRVCQAPLLHSADTASAAPVPAAAGQQTPPMTRI